MITAHGVPLSLYHDRHSIFQRNDPHWTLAEQLAGKQVSHSTRTRSATTRHSADPRLLSSSQGPHRARLAHLSGPPGQRTSPRPRHHPAAGQRRACPLLRRLQSALRPSPRRCRFRLSPPAPPLRPRPLPQPALPAGRGRRSHRHLRRAVDPVATLARSSRLRWRNRRTLPSTRRRVARLSRRHLADRSAFHFRRTRRTPPCAAHLRTETKTHDASHL